MEHLLDPTIELQAMDVDPEGKYKKQEKDLDQNRCRQVLVFLLTFSFMYHMI